MFVLRDMGKVRITIEVNCPPRLLDSDQPIEELLDRNLPGNNGWFFMSYFGSEEHVDRSRTEDTGEFTLTVTVKGTFYRDHRSELEFKRKLESWLDTVVNNMMFIVGGEAYRVIRPALRELSLESIRALGVLAADYRTSADQQNMVASRVPLIDRYVAPDSAFGRLQENLRTNRRPVVDAHIDSRLDYRFNPEPDHLLNIEPEKPRQLSQLPFGKEFCRITPEELQAAGYEAVPVDQAQPGDIILPKEEDK